jgi:hypothetical protein
LFGKNINEHIFVIDSHHHCTPYLTEFRCLIKVAKRGPLPVTIIVMQNVEG